MKPYISVIVPIYNAEAYIERCLNSITAQTFTDIEILCIDDHSSDNSVSIVESMKKTDNRIKFIKNDKNSGLSAVRNMGIKLASAPYVMSVDSDDFIDQSTFANISQIASAGNFDIVAFGWREIDCAGNIIEEIKYDSRDILLAAERKNIFSITNPSFCMKLCRKSIFIENAISFPEGTLFEDMVTTPRMLLKAKTMRIVSDIYYNYTIRPGSIMNSITATHLMDYLYCFDLLKRFLSDENILNECADSYNGYIEGNIEYYTAKICSSVLPQTEKDKYINVLSLIRDASVLRETSESPVEPDKNAVKRFLARFIRRDSSC